MAISIHVQSVNIQIRSVTIIKQQQYGKFLRPVAIPIQLKSIYTHFMPSGNINTVPIKANLYAQWLPQYTRLLAILIHSLEIKAHMPSGCLIVYAQWQY